MLRGLWTLATSISTKGLGTGTLETFGWHKHVKHRYNKTSPGLHTYHRLDITKHHMGALEFSWKIPLAETTSELLGYIILKQLRYECVIPQVAARFPYPGCNRGKLKVYLSGSPKETSQHPGCGVVNPKDMNAFFSANLEVTCKGWKTWKLFCRCFFSAPLVVNRHDVCRSTGHPSTSWVYPSPK